MFLKKIQRLLLNRPEYQKNKVWRITLDPEKFPTRALLGDVSGIPVKGSADEKSIDFRSYVKNVKKMRDKTTVKNRQDFNRVQQDMEKIRRNAVPSDLLQNTVLHSSRIRWINKSGSALF